MKKYIIANANIITRERTIPKGALCISSGKIDAVWEYLPENISKDIPVYDAEGSYISPGFIDIHLHGGNGSDFLSGDSDKNIECCKMHMQHGTTSLVPTFSTSDYTTYRNALRGISETMKNMKGMADVPNILGVHMEGPYLSPSQLGAQSPDFIIKPDEKDYIPLLEDYPFILRWTIAPETEGVLSMVRKLAPLGIHFSIGHSDALFEDVIKAYELGVNCITHLYSACSTVRRINAYRHAGIIEAAYYLDDMNVEIIADGKHLPPSLLKLIYKIKGRERVCLITDAISAAGLSPDLGEIYDMSSKQTIIIEDGVGKLKDRSAFAGSIATADLLVHNMVKLADVPLIDAVKMMSYNPAKLIGMENKKGSIANGMDADLIMFNDDIQIQKVIVAGQEVYNEK
ncbi:MAG: N-acetylglucosamine-6-phosphate deacetylase [Eubacteriales bacterium]|nr:N-acetylglucosamine-6-phosphate deacetylase [Eubacteriales bacterium]